MSTWASKQTQRFRKALVALGLTSKDDLTLDALTGKQVKMLKPVALPTYNLAGLPSASTYNRCIVHCSNGWGGNPGILFSNGTNWLRLDTGATAS